MEALKAKKEIVLEAFYRTFNRRVCKSDFIDKLVIIININLFIVGTLDLII